MSTATLLPEHVQAKHFRPHMLIALVVIHAAALAAPWTFTWEGLAALVIMNFVTGCLGITLCYHRLLSHRSYKTPKFVKYFLMLCGTLAMEGDPAWWTATHRLHHRESDQPLDPHSPTVNFLWAHMLWLLYDDDTIHKKETMKRFIPDLVNDPWAKFLEKNFLAINVGFLLALYGLGYWLGGAHMALSLLVWGGFLRIVYTWHGTWLVNSATHVWGYRNYETRDQSRNTWWVAAITFGEGWHNNHHANPSAAKAGHRWWEFDLTYCVLTLMKWTGLAYKILPVVKQKPATVEVIPITEAKKSTAGK